MKIWKIYKHTCIENGKSYIGQTCMKNVEQRWRHGNGYKSNSTASLFWNAICAHGGVETWNTAWTHEIIEDNITSLAEANAREIYWIKYYHTWKYDEQCQGYNLTPGGGCVNGSRLVYKDGINIKVSLINLSTYLEDGWLLHDSEEYQIIRRHLWYIEHKEEQDKRTKQYHQQYRERMNAINRANCKKYYQTEEYRQHKKEYRAAHKEQEKLTSQRAAAKRKLDPDYKRKHAEANKRWREKQKLSQN